MPNLDDDLDFFESRRRFLFGLAYRMLGTRDAEDIVQETFIRWRQADRASLASPAAWLTTVCTNLCVDFLRSADNSRVDYTGTWLPEPLHTALDDTPETHMELASSLTTAFLLLLERLTPRERAAYLLHEIFDMPYGDVATALGMQEAACRKLVSRAQTALGTDRSRHATPVARQQELLAAFQCALQGGGTTALAAMLSDDIRLSGDGGGKANTVRHDLLGKEDVLRFVERGMARFWRGQAWEETMLNGVMGMVIREHGRAIASMTFAYDADGRLTGIYLMRNPDKLARL
jgi:RNA polymerase sigma-70 factor (ECF subfamily)